MVSPQTNSMSGTPYQTLNLSRDSFLLLPKLVYVLVLSMYVYVATNYTQITTVTTEIRSSKSGKYAELELLLTPRSREGSGSFSYFRSQTLQIVLPDMSGPTLFFGNLLLVSRIRGWSGF